MNRTNRFRSSRVIRSALLIAGALPWLAPFLIGDAAKAQEEYVALRRAAESLSSSVVQIETTGGRERVGDLFIAAGPSTGVVVSDDGLIVTSSFTVIHEPTTILVRLPDGSRAPADILARDLARNLVLLSCPQAAGLAVPVATPEDELIVGAFAVAVGRVFDPRQVNTSVGIVSALDRVWGKAIQTDAKVSPNNYGGPLVDLQGRVIGILVPISPQSDAELAGFEWYDSGIGFAVPFASILNRLERWRTPEDLYPGRMGITPKASDNFTQPLEIAAVARLSPAGAAGLLPGDQVVELAGRTIRRFPDLKHAIGAHYAGETVVGVVERNGERSSFELTLAKEIEPFRIAALGIEPRAAFATAEPNERGVVIESLGVGSPAENAGLQGLDRIVSVASKTIDDLDDLATELAAFAPGETTTLGIERFSPLDGTNETFELSVTLKPLTADLPKPGFDSTVVIDPETSCEVRELRLEQFPEGCDVVLPIDHRVDGSAGLVVWLGEPGKHDAQELRRRWGEAAVRERLVIIAPHASESRRWARTDIERIGALVQRAIGDFGIDRRLTTVTGTGAGAPLAALVATDPTRPVQGLAVIGQGLPVGVVLPENEPLRRLSIALWLATDVADLEPVRQLVQQLEEQGIPIAVVPSPDPAAVETLPEIGRWTMSLDRH